MKLSVIIINKNRADQLKRILFCLHHQTYQNYKDFEIVIIDGKSTDGSLSILEEYNTSSLLKYHILNEPLNLSRYRNYGAKKAKGDLLVFLDVDMLIPNDFIEIMLQKYCKAENEVILHYIYGFRLEYSFEIMKEISEIEYSNLRKAIKSTLMYSDFRENHFELYEDINKIPAPWVYGWSGALSISKNTFTCVKGFNETLTGWGSEDTDLCYRIYQNGAKFVVEKDAFAFHVPHPNFYKNKKEQNEDNRYLIHKQQGVIETELYTIFSGVNLNNVLFWVRNLNLASFTPFYRIDFLDSINEKIEKSKSLCVGLVSYRELQYLNFTNYLAPNDLSYQLISKVIHNGIVEKLLGICTHYDNKYFDYIYIFDAYLCFPKELLAAVYNEMGRIGKCVIQVKTIDYNPPIYNYVHNKDNYKIEELKYSVRGDLLSE